MYATAQSCCCWRDWGCVPVTSPSFASATSTGEAARYSSRARGAIKCACRCLRRSATRFFAYLDHRPKMESSDRVFLRSNAPVGPFKSGDGVSSVVKHALQRAGIESPAKGAHLLRHTAATQMLRHGVPLDQIGLVLRHRSLDMTAYYAKVDTSLLLRHRTAVAGGALMMAAVEAYLAPASHGRICDEQCGVPAA